MESLKFATACWQVAQEAVSRRRIASARHHVVETVRATAMFVAESDSELSQWFDFPNSGPSLASAALEGCRWIVEDCDLTSSYRYMRDGSTAFRLGPARSLAGDNA